MNNKRSYFSYLSYFIILVFWLAVIVGILYSPRLPDILPHKKTINILSWGGIFDAETLARFTDKTGIKVNVSFYSTNEELLVYLKATKGETYDLVVPSDYAVRQLKHEGLIKHIDKTKLDFIKTINPNLMGHDFDKTNDYSLPYMVEIFGLGYDKNYFKQGLAIPSLEWIFKPHGFTIVMVNDAIEAVSFAAHYLYRPFLGKATLAEVKEIKDLLITQREWIEAYSDFRPDYFLLTNNCPLVITPYSSYLRSAAQSPAIGFALLRDGTFMSIENLAISAASTKDDAIYEFMNYVYTDDVVKHHFKTRSSLPATLNVLSDLALNEDMYKTLTQSRDDFIKNVVFFSPIMSERLLHELWIAVKSR